MFVDRNGRVKSNQDVRGAHNGVHARLKTDDSAAGGRGGFALHPDFLGKAKTAAVDDAPRRFASVRN
jgi:hypothetical protein